MTYRRSLSVSSKMETAAAEIITITPGRTGLKAIIPQTDVKVWFGDENITGDPEIFIRANGIPVNANNMLEVLYGETVNTVAVVNAVAGAGVINVHVLV